MSESVEPVEALTAAEERNPLEMPLSIFGPAAFFGGLICSGIGSANVVDAFGEQGWGAPLAVFGNQLSTVGVMVVIGLAFYFMVQWNKTHQR